MYRTVTRPLLVHGVDTLVLKKAQQKKVDVAEIRMLQWMCGVTKLDRTRNEQIVENESGRKLKDLIEERSSINYNKKESDVNGNSRKEKRKI